MAASDAQKLVARAGPHEAGEAWLRAVHRDGLDLADPRVAGYAKNIRREERRKASRTEAEAEVPVEASDLDAVRRAREIERSGELPKGERAKPRRSRTETELAAKVEAHAIKVLGKHVGRAWTERDTAELRDAVGADEAKAWPFVLAGPGPRAIQDGGWRADHRPALLALRRAVQVEVDDHHALGPKPVPLSALAAASVLCGDHVVVSKAQMESGVTAGEVLRKIQAALAPLRTH